jgi:hypothetical protein
MDIWIVTGIVQGIPVIYEVTVYIILVRETGKGGDSEAFKFIICELGAGPTLP